MTSRYINMANVIKHFRENEETRLRRLSLLNNDMSNPYRERGFFRGTHGTKVILSKFLFCFSLETGIQIMAAWEVVSAMTYLTLVLVNVKTLFWLFYLIHFAISITKLSVLGTFNRIDSQKTR